MKNMMTIIHKELKRFFSDKRMLVFMALPGLMIFLLYSFMGVLMTSMNGIDQDYVYQVYVLNQPSELTYMNSVEGMIIHTSDASTLSEASILAMIENKDYDLLIKYEADFMSKVEAYDSEVDIVAPSVELYYNSSKNESYAIYEHYWTSLNAYETSLTNKFDMNTGTSRYDLVSDVDASIQFIVMLVPFLLILFLFQGAGATVTESIAGEKERGTIATLLATPVRRHQIALGKIIALGICALASATSSFIGLMASLPNMAGEALTFSMYGMDTYILLFIVLISTTLIFVALLALVSAYAKSVKEASQIAMPFMIIVMLVGISTMTGVVNTKTIYYFIPVYNSVQCIISILSLQANTLNLGITILMNLALVGIGVYVLTRMFDSEKIMFNK